MPSLSKLSTLFLVSAALAAPTSSDPPHDGEDDKWDDDGKWDHDDEWGNDGEVYYSKVEMNSQERANAVKEAFQYAWDGYYQCVLNAIFGL